MGLLNSLVHNKRSFKRNVIHPHDTMLAMRLLPAVLRRVALRASADDVIE
jgi:hypothetical protein